MVTSADIVSTQAGTGYNDQDPNEFTTIDQQDGLVIDGNGVATVTKGTAPTTFNYDAVEDTVVGGGFISNASSTSVVDACASVFNRDFGFSSTRGSSTTISNSAAYTSKRGFSCEENAGMSCRLCSSSVNDYGFSVNRNSVLNLARCCAVFPTAIGMVAWGNSTISPDDVECMTYFWGTVTVVPTLFSSKASSWISNYNTKLGRAEAVVPNSGGLGRALTKDTVWLRFIWVSFKVNDNGSLSYTEQQNQPGPSQTPNASWRYVPIQHSIDWTNIVSSTDVSNNSTSALPQSSIPVISFRTGYASVKPPTGLKAPEDGSGSITAGISAGTYSLTNLSGWL